MSCHDIGRALNSVQEKILELYEAKKLDKEITRELLLVSTKAVWWCDGNEYEATKTFDLSYCGNCLEQGAEGDYLYSLWEADVKQDFSARYKFLSAFEKKHRLVGSYLCEKCFEKALKELGFNEEEIEKEKRKQEKETK